MVSELSFLQKRLKFQASRRSTREMEQLLLPLVEQQIRQFSDEECEKILLLLEWPDIQLYDWITGLTPVPAGVAVTVLQRLYAESLPSPPP